MAVIAPFSTKKCIKSDLNLRVGLLFEERYIGNDITFYGNQRENDSLIKELKSNQQIEVLYARDEFQRATFNCDDPSWESF